MGLNNKDLFLVSQHEGVNDYKDRKVTFQKLKSELGVRLAVEEVTGPSGGIIDGTPGLMYPDASFNYDRSTGRLSVPLDARGVTFVDVINSTNQDRYPTGSEVAGDFFICNEADLQVSATKWLGIGADGGLGVGASGSLNDPGRGYRSNNGSVTVTTLKSSTEHAISVGPMTLTLFDGRIIGVEHDETNIDIPSLNLVGGLYEFGPEGTYDFDEPAVVEVVGLDSTDTSHKIRFKIISEGLGYRDLEGDGGVLTNALAIPTEGDVNNSFRIDITVNGDGEVISIDEIRLAPGHVTGDTFYISPGYNSNPAVPAEFELTLTTAEEFKIIQINDKLIKRSDGYWTVLNDELARQSVLTITNEEGPDGDLTPALKIKLENDDPRYVTLAIDDVTSDNSGLMPSDLYDLVNGLEPDYIAGGTVVDILTDEETAYDQVGGADQTSEDFNPISAEVVQREDEDGNLISEDLVKDYKLSIRSAALVSSGGGSTRTRGAVYIASAEELKEAIGLDEAGTNFEYDHAVNAALAGDHLMPRDLENLDPRGEDYRTAKRLKVTTTKYQLEAEDTSFADLTATLTYEDGTEVSDNTTYSYSWEGVEYLGGKTEAIGGDTETVRVTGVDFNGPTNITCTVTETTDAEFQTLDDSVYLHFGGGVSGPIDPPDIIDPPETDPPLLGSLVLTGPHTVALEKDGDLNFHTYTATVTNTTADDHVYEFESSDESVARIVAVRGTHSEEVEVEFIGEGEVTISVVVSSEQAEDNASDSIDVTVKPYELVLPSLYLRKYDNDPVNLTAKVEHILSNSQYDFDITYTLEVFTAPDGVDASLVTIEPIEGARTASQFNNFLVTVPEAGTYKLKGTAFPTDSPEEQYTVTSYLNAQFNGTERPTPPPANYISWKVYALNDGDTAKVKVHVYPSSVFKRLNLETNMWESQGTRSNITIDNPGVKDAYSDWYVESLYTTRFRFEKINGTGDYPEVEFDLNSTTPALNSLEETFNAFRQEKGSRPFDLSWIDTSQVTNMRRCFQSSRLTKNDLNIDGWDVSKVRNMSDAFSSAVVRADIRSWNPSSNENMYNCFYMAGSSSGINYWTPEASATYWNFRGVQNMQQCWYGTKNPFYNWDQARVEAWDMSTVTNARAMFNFGNYNEVREPLAWAIRYNEWCAEKMDHNNTRSDSKFHGWWSKTYSGTEVPEDQLPQWMQPCS